ncbi:hypothetical protein EW145_g2934 [Phellinidium pouzarii]|uniref:Six-hairpin glycosidase-like protein n=1 Tax=Phellinidium pouzarii TaxID=167371 RepID=A0A4S4LAK9_9AGAM|nr:hypothetical protein EW145_g2934 [Phellinidium pouzarii]
MRDALFTRLLFLVLGTSPAMLINTLILLTSCFIVLGTASTASSTKIDRRAVVSHFNPTRNASSPSTPVQVGNGNFAFGADITGLQTFSPFAIMSSWGWKNDSLPPGRTYADILNYTGESLDNHGRNVTYMYGGAPDLQQWLIANPNRVNLARVGLLFLTPSGAVRNVSEADLSAKMQSLDLWEGQLTSTFELDGTEVRVTTLCAQDSDTVGVALDSDLVAQGQLGLFFDFPWNDGSQKFSAPFVGVFNMSSNHTTYLASTIPTEDAQAQITHTLVNNSFITTLGGAPFTITRDTPAEHRYSVHPATRNATNFSISVNFALQPPDSLSSFDRVRSEDTRAEELQRRIILSQYLLRVNEAGDYPPQESGLVNNGWYGKFHMEMYFWHCVHWSLWSQSDLLERSSTVYSRFLPTALARAQIQQGFPHGTARWSKMTDPTGRSSPGEINELLIWQQVHPLVFAEYAYRLSPTRDTLDRWRDVVRVSADWMYTDPLVTRNPAFELAYWRLGLSLAESWFARLGEPASSSWAHVREGLAPLPVEGGVYAVYEGIDSDFWDGPTYTNDHPSLVGLYGWLPPTEGLDVQMAKLTMEKVWTHWNISNCWGWDFGMLAMSAARNGEPEHAVEWLLDPIFTFDDVGMPTGGARAPVPYFPGSGGLLLAVAMMAEGWDGDMNSTCIIVDVGVNSTNSINLNAGRGKAPGFPENGWNVRVEGMHKVL